MCVLTYVPISENGFIVTSNRDENIARPKAKPPKKIVVNGIELFCPVDPISKGTWIATSKFYTLVLLNGGHEKHEVKSNYRQSRGQVIIEFTKWNSPTVFFEEFDFTDMEPFTLLVFDNKNRNEITEIRWSKEKKYLNNLSGDQSRIWSSATLYDSQASENRENWFLKHLTNAQELFSGEYILDFHLNGGSHDPLNSIKLKRDNGIETVCITQIEIYPDAKSLLFNDLISKTNKRLIIF
jgi:uncharacterized protein with NRDE domain